MKHTIIFLFSSLFLFSCQNILVEKPKAITEENFYRTPAEVQAAVDGIFAPLKDYNCFGFLYPAQLVCYSDFAEGRGSYAPISQFQGLDNTNIGRIQLIWTDFYTAIRNANNVILNLTTNTYIPDNLKNMYLGEARFLRAFTYFQIVKNWGKAVLRTEKNMLTEDVPLDSAADVYSFIENDLVFAEANLPVTTSDPGYPTSGAAKTLLADVYFYQGDYSEALNLAKEVINSGDYALVKIKTYQDFEENLYGADLVTSPEEIFYLKFSRLPGDVGWNYVGFLNNTDSGYYNSSALWAIYLDTVQYKVWSSWDDRDIRKQLWYPADKSQLGPNAMLSRKFIDPETIQSGTQAGNDDPLYRYADLLLLYAESECRVNGITPGALEALNEVRRRGYGYDPTEPSSIDYTLSDFQNNPEMFIDTVIKERGYEDCIEGGKRWFDLKRLGKDFARQIIEEHTGKNIADKHFLWPFPPEEMDLNKSITQSDQNPGY